MKAEKQQQQPQCALSVIALTQGQHRVSEIVVVVIKQHASWVQIQARSHY